METAIAEWRLAGTKRDARFAASIDEWFITIPVGSDAEESSAFPLAWVDESESREPADALLEFGALGCRSVVFQTAHGATVLDTPVAKALFFGGEIVAAAIAKLMAALRASDGEERAYTLGNEVHFAARAQRSGSGGVIVMTRAAGFFGMNAGDKSAFVSSLRELAALANVRVTAPIDAPFASAFESVSEEDNLDPEAVCALQPDTTYLQQLEMKPWVTLASRAEAALHALLHPSSRAIIGDGAALDPNTVIPRLGSPTTAAYVALVDAGLRDLALAHPVSQLLVALRMTDIADLAAISPAWDVLAAGIQVTTVAVGEDAKVNVEWDDEKKRASYAQLTLPTGLPPTLAHQEEANLRHLLDVLVAVASDVLPPFVDDDD